MQLTEVPLDVTLPSVSPLFVSFRGLPFHAALRCNGRLVEFFESGGENYGQALLTNELRKGKNEIRLLVWGPLQSADLSQVRMFTLTQNLSQSATWSWRAWEHAKTPAPHAAGQPAWFSMHFARPAGHRPLYVRIGEAATASKGKSRAASHPFKGQIFLNNYNLGRFWTAGPQDRYYIPEPTLKDQNELLLFEEHGLPPQCHLEFGESAF